MKRTRLVSILVLAVVMLALPMVANAYSYSGIHWDSTRAYYDDRQYTMPSGFIAAIEAAASSWNNAGANFGLQLSTSSSNDWYMANLGDTGTIGQTWTSYDTITYHIVSSTTAFNSQKSFSTDGSANTYDVESVAVHEFGHWLRLNDIGYPADAVMNGNITVTQIRRSLTTDDIQGISSIYGPKI